MTNFEHNLAHKNAQRLAQTGGGFHSRLGELFYKADRHNAEALIKAFPEEFLRPVEGMEANDE